MLLQVNNVSNVGSDLLRKLENELLLSPSQWKAFVPVPKVEERVSTKGLLEGNILRRA